MIDFDALVLGPCQAAFSRPVTVTPLASLPGAPAYAARGIWDSEPKNVDLIQGIMSSQIHRLDVRTSELPAPIEQGDEIEVPAHKALRRIGLCSVEDTDDDGQGGLTITLKVIGA